MTERIIIIISLVVTSLILLAVSITAWRRRSLGYPAVFLSICLAGVAIYSLGYGLELASSTLTWAMFWVRFQHWGIQVIAPTWLLFAMVVSGQDRRISKKLIILISIIPAYLFLTSQTLGWLNLAHHNPRLEIIENLPVFIYDRNLFNYIAIAYYLLCLAISIGLFINMLVRSAPSFRKQAGIFLVGSIIPLFPLVAHNLNKIQSNLDITPLALGVSGVLFTYGVLKFRVLDIIPMARDAIFDNMNTGVLILDYEDRVIDFNPALQKILPEINGSMIGLSAKDLFLTEPHLQIFINQGQTGRMECELTHGMVKAHYRVNCSEIFDKRKRQIGKIISFYEFTNEKKLMDTLEKQAALDGLTGVFNRQHFDTMAAKELSRIQRYGGEMSLVMMDLDHFKAINDRYGHQAGDQVLTTIANIFNSILRQSDILARFGGDEFLILLPETNLEKARLLAKRLCEALDCIHVEYESRWLDISGSFGVASIDASSVHDLPTLYRQADRAMYFAKNAGGNQVSVFRSESVRV